MFGKDKNELREQALEEAIKAKEAAESRTEPEKIIDAGQAIEQEEDALERAEDRYRAVLPRIRSICSLLEKLAENGEHIPDTFDPDDEGEYGSIYADEKYLASPVRNEGRTDFRKLLRLCTDGNETFVQSRYDDQTMLPSGKYGWHKSDITVRSADLNAFLKSFDDFEKDFYEWFDNEYPVKTE